MKKVLTFGMIAFLAMSFVACHNDDPDNSNVTPPVVAVAPNTLSGVVADMQGNALGGATVTLGAMTATTDNEGVYFFSDVAEGTHVVTAAAEGMISVSTVLEVVKSETTQNLVWNATLSREVSADVNVTIAGGGSGSVESEALVNNDEGKVEIEVTVPENIVPKDTKITITPIYTEESASISRAARADESTMLIGATLSCSDATLELKDNIDLKFNLDGSIATSVVAKKYINGQWVEVPNSVIDDNVVISAKEFTAYGIFLRVDVSKKVSTESIVFEQSEWDNLYGSRTVYVSEASFAYKVGTQINTTATNKLEGLLIEYLSRLCGAGVKTVNGSYPINVELPVGTALQIAGAQERTEVTVSGNDKSVTGTSYGTTTVRVTTYNRQHNGGGSVLQ